MKVLKIALIFLVFALGMFVNKVMSIQPKAVSKVVEMKPGETVKDLDLNYDLYNCTRLTRTNGKTMKFCVRKEEMVKEPGKNYVRGVTIPKDTDNAEIFIDKNLDNCSIAHELSHLEGLGEKEAYDISSLCYQLKDKGIWKN